MGVNKAFEGVIKANITNTRDEQEWQLYKGGKAGITHYNTLQYLKNTI